MKVHNYIAQTTTFKTVTYIQCFFLNKALGHQTPQLQPKYFPRVSGCGTRGERERYHIFTAHVKTCVFIRGLLLGLLD